jgi:hypothetical protein
MILSLVLLQDNILEVCTKSRGAMVRYPKSNPVWFLAMSLGKDQIVTSPIFIQLL